MPPRGELSARRGTARLLLAIASLCSAACSPAGEERRGPSVVLPSGTRYAVEISATPELRAKGLMYRESLAERHGMLFLFPKPSVEGFWMKNCNFPIDIVWMDADRKVLFINAHTPPCREDPCPTYGPKVASLYVLEIPDGAAKSEEIVVGSELKFEGVPNVPSE